MTNEEIQGLRMILTLIGSGFALVLALVLAKAAYDGIHNMWRKK